MCDYCILKAVTLLRSLLNIGKIQPTLSRTTLQRSNFTQLSRQNEMLAGNVPSNYGHIPISTWPKRLTFLQNVWYHIQITCLLPDLQFNRWRRLWWSYTWEGCQASDRSSTLCFTVHKCETTGYCWRGAGVSQHLWAQHHWMFLTIPRHNLQHFFVASPVVFAVTKAGYFNTSLVDFVPKPHQTVSIVFSQHNIDAHPIRALEQKGVQCLMLGLA